MLDRLNPLLEPGGVLLLTECGTSPDGDSEEGQSEGEATTHRVIRPHPNFRLFLTADPSCGEVSRAMRNRCVEIALLETQPALLPAAPDTSSQGDVDVPVTVCSEYVTDLFSLVRAAGLSGAAESNAAVAVHSALVARRSRGRGDESSGEGPSPRALLLLSDIVASLRSRVMGSAVNIGINGPASLNSVEDEVDHIFRQALVLAYPGLSPGSTGSLAERLIAESALASCLQRTTAAQEGRGADVLSSGWREFIDQSVVHHVKQDVKVLDIALALASNMSQISTPRLSFVFDTSSRAMSAVAPSAHTVHPVPTKYLLLEERDKEFLMSTVSFATDSLLHHGYSNLVIQAAVSFAWKAGEADRCLRHLVAARLPAHPIALECGIKINIGDAVSSMMATFFDSRAWCDISSMMSECVCEEDSGRASSKGNDTPDGLVRMRAVALDRFSAADPRSNHEAFQALTRSVKGSHDLKWDAVILLLDLFGYSVVKRHCVILSERAELSAARTRITGEVPDGEHGLGWLGISCLVCEGGRDASRVGARGRGGCPETRLARVTLLPYLLLLLRGVDDVIDLLVVREAAEIAVDNGANNAEVLLTAVKSVLKSRDTLSAVLLLPKGEPGHDGSKRPELLFLWDNFLVAWSWLDEALDVLHSAITASGIGDFATMPLALANLKAVTARVHAAVLEHAGGAPPAKDTLWQRGSRATAPSTARGALALGRLYRLADQFRVLPSRDFGNGGGPPGVGERGRETSVSLGMMMRDNHPALCVPTETRQELLYALCTLHWATSSELENDEPSTSNKSSRCLALPVVSSPPSGKPLSHEVVALTDMLPSALENAVTSARSQFEVLHKGTRLGAIERQDGLQHQDDLDLGERFDDFDTEAAEAVANATLLVISSNGGASVAGNTDGPDGGIDQLSCRRGILHDWASVQLSPLREHWIAVEEGEILSLLADLGEAGFDNGSLIAGRDTRRKSTEQLMNRVACLRSAILATPSLSPAVARPYQTLLWAWENSSSWGKIHGPLLFRLLPVALEPWSRRLWENVGCSSFAVSMKLAPPEMVPAPEGNCVDGGPHGGASPPLGSSPSGDVYQGPAQLLTLARSSFLLQLSSTVAFFGAVPTGSRGFGVNGTVDLTLMNASARLGQYQETIRIVRDLKFADAGALKPLVRLTWARLRSTLQAYDGLAMHSKIDDDKHGRVADNLFHEALPSANLVVGGGRCDIVFYGEVEAALKRALKNCPDERLRSQSNSLVLPASLCLLKALCAVSGLDDGKSSNEAQASAGIGIALLGCLRLVLLLPSSPVDPGLRPALKNDLLVKRLDGLKSQLTVNNWSLRLEGGGDVSPQVKTKLIILQYDHYLFFLAVALFTILLRLHGSDRYFLECHFDVVMVSRVRVTIIFF